MSHSAQHPARSAEFLSRLHDGELTAGERAQFESHRAHCGECRNAAFEFEAALSLYRSSRPKPPAPDLSVRILRKLQQSNRRRPPLGASFGIDLRWAGAFAAALIAAIVGFSVVARQEASRKLAVRDAVAIPVTMEQKAAENEAAAKPAASARAVPPESAPRARREAATAKDAKANTRSDGSNAYAPEQHQTMDAAPAPSIAQQKELAAGDRDTLSSGQSAGPKRMAAAQQAPALGSVSAHAGDRPGGEGSALSSMASDAVELLPVRLVITAVDSGSAPELLGEEKRDLPASERGREYSLIVDAQGRVSDVRSVEKPLEKKTKALRAEAGKSEVVQTAKPPQALWDLRFRPADRPRLLRVKIE
jgi:hypothetical protein